MMTSSSLSREDIVCLALRSWDAPWKNNQQVTSRLARTNRVLYFGPPASLRDSLHALQRRLPSSPLIEKPADGVFLYHPPRLLARSRHSGIYNSLTDRLRLMQVRRLAWRLGFRRPILWMYDPMRADAVGTFSEKLVVYHVIDNYFEYVRPSQPRLRAAMAKNHIRMLRAADMVFTVSESLYAQCRDYNPHCYHIPNGVDFERFHTASANEITPPDLTGIPRPLIGYVGVIQPTVDFDLLHTLVDRRPDWSLVLIGPLEDLGEQDKFGALLTRPNVYYLGPKAIAEVPHYVNACDVGILPYRINALTAHIDSLKVYEYLACGCPIAATDIPSIRRFAHVIEVAPTPSQFPEAVERALAERGVRTEQRIGLAREASWDLRVEAMGTIIQEHLTRRETQSGATGVAVTAGGV